MNMKLMHVYRGSCRAEVHMTSFPQSYKVPEVSWTVKNGHRLGHENCYSQKFLTITLLKFHQYLWIVSSWQNIRTWLMEFLISQFMTCFCNGCFLPDSWILLLIHWLKRYIILFQVGLDSGNGILIILVSIHVKHKVTSSSSHDRCGFAEKCDEPHRQWITWKKIAKKS